MLRTLFFLFLLLIAAGFFLFFYAAPWLGEKAAAIVPVDAEIAIGESVSKIYEEQNTENDSASYYLNNFIGALELDDTYEIKAKVLSSKDINAFALPGGRIFIYSGILDKMNSYEELVALLGHELTHITNRHSLKSICRSAATGIALSAVFGDVHGISGIILSKADEFKQLDYSRELETEADNYGLQVMVQNKVDPKGMLDLLKLLKEEGSEMPHLMKYLSTHPETDSRIQNISSNPDVKQEFKKNKKLEAIFAKIKGSL